MNQPNSAPRVFANRAAAGTELARALKHRTLQPPLTVLGLPRGGVAVAAPVAKALRAALGVVVMRKVGMPGQPGRPDGYHGSEDRTMTQFLRRWCP